jgi:formate hydrogenlyase subunit 3/multisubunit Na+/H+ antiporter MnhD subunit
VGGEHARDVAEKGGIGLYTHEQEKNTTAFDYFAKLVLGSLIAALGGLLLYHGRTVHGEEIRKYGSADTNIRGWVWSLVLIVIGLFVAHAGLIFYLRRIAKRLSRSADRSRS